MEVVQPRFSVNPDPELWISVPLDFPSAEGQTAESWAWEITLAILEGIDGVTEPTKRQFMLLAQAIALADSPLPDAQARFWYFPVVGGPMQLAHLYAAPREQLAELTLVEVAAGGAGEPTPQRVEECDIAGFREAWCVTLLDEIPGESLRQLAGHTETSASATPFGSIRIIGDQHGVVLMLEASGTDLYALAGMKEDLIALFGTVVMGSATH